MDAPWRNVPGPAKVLRVAPSPRPLVLVRRFAALWIVLLLLLAAEVGLRLLPMEYASGAGIFLTVDRRKLADSDRPEFDYVILGDSRSLSLNGHAPTAGAPYSVYNFSLPALGPRYFRHYLRKILANRKHKPAAVIFAGDPRHFQANFYRPHHDPVGAYSDSSDESLTTYISKRFTRRIRYAVQGGQPVLDAAFQNMLWDTFSHRYLHLFSVSELARQYSGAERVFIVGEALPLVSHIFRYRRAIETYTVGLSATAFRDVPVPSHCGSCSSVLKPECFPEMSHPQDNRLMAALIRRQYGGINIGDRLKPEQRMMTLMLRDKGIEEYRRIYNNEKPDLRELVLLVNEAERQGIQIVFVEVPNVDAYAGTRFYVEYDQQLAELLKQHPSARRIDFPARFYPRELYIEHVHYSCEGAARLNADFYRDVMPQILKFAPPATDGRVRGFPGS